MTYFSGAPANRFAILPGCDVAARRTHRITVIYPGAGHIVTANYLLGVKTWLSTLETVNLSWLDDHVNVDPSA